MKKVCEYIDNNFKLCLVLFAVVFGFAALDQPIVLCSNQFGYTSVLGIGNLISSLTLLSSNSLFYIIILSLIIIVSAYILIGLCFKCSAARIKIIITLLSIFSIVMLGIALFSIIFWTSNSEYSDLITYWLMYLPSLLGFALCSFFSTSYTVYKFKQ